MAKKNAKLSDKAKDAITGLFACLLIFHWYMKLWRLEVADKKNAAAKTYATDEAAKKEKELKLGNLIAFVDTMRDALLFRTIVTRAYAFHEEEYDTPEDIGRDESVFAIISLLYLLAAAFSLYLQNKDLTTATKNKMWYNLIDGVTWSAISIMRFPGTVFEKLDASEWDGMSEAMLDNFVLGCYGFELIYTFWYNCKQLDHYTKLLANTTDPALKADYQYEVTKAQLAVGIGFVYLSLLITSVALRIAVKGSPAGLLLMISASVLNQVINLVIAASDLNRALTKYNTKLLALDSKSPDYSDQKKLLDADLYKAQKKFGFEFMKINMILASLAVLALGNPFGFSMFAMGLVIYLTFKTTVFAYEKYHEAKNPALSTAQWDTTPSSTTFNGSENGSPHLTPKSQL
jgi:hypothetical protein